MISDFKEFNPITSRLDILLYDTMAINSSYSSLWSCVSKLLLLSHGQATVERGFSFNRQLEVENLRDETYEAQRSLDHLASIGGE